nr:hypothetical protein Itr_chr11CG12270 [Ipomoea trifida]
MATSSTAKVISNLFPLSARYFTATTVSSLGIYHSKSPAAQDFTFTKSKYRSLLCSPPSVQPSCCETARKFASSRHCTYFQAAKANPPRVQESMQGFLKNMSPASPLPRSTNINSFFVINLRLRRSLGRRNRGI